MLSVVCQRPLLGLISVLAVRFRHRVHAGIGTRPARLRWFLLPLLLDFNESLIK